MIHLLLWFSSQMTVDVRRTCIPVAGAFAESRLQILGLGQLIQEEEEKEVVEMRQRRERFGAAMDARSLQRERVRG